MSVKSKMTEIANIIRKIVGITDPIGLDDILKYLDTIQNDILNAFSMIGKKGGTVPSSIISGNLVSALSSIPVNGGKESGTFTTNSSGAATINCNFIPDLVMIHYNEHYNGTLKATTAVFAEYGSGLNTTLHMDSYNAFTDWVIRRNNTTISLTAEYYGGSGWTAIANRTFYYTVIKYT